MSMNYPQCHVDVRCFKLWVMIKTIFIKKKVEERKQGRKENHISCWRKHRNKYDVHERLFMSLKPSRKNKFLPKEFFNLHFYANFKRTKIFSIFFLFIPNNRWRFNLNFMNDITCCKVDSNFRIKFYDVCKEEKRKKFWTLGGKARLHRQENSLGEKKLSIKEKSFFLCEKFYVCAQQIGVSSIMYHDTFFLYNLN